MGFQKIEGAKRRSSSVAEQILDAVKQGTYKEGSKLPPERELARLMAVSRNSVREAISALQLAGFVNTRVGDGSYIAQGAPPHYAQGASALPGMGIGLLGIWLARKEIEQILLQEALEKATQVDLDELKAILLDMDAALAERSGSKFSLGDVAFHLRIADLSNNHSLVRAEQQLLSVSRQFYRILDHSETPRTLRHLERSLATHRCIVDAIENHDVIFASRAMEEHFQVVINYLGSALEQDCDFCLSPLVSTQHEETLSE